MADDPNPALRAELEAHLAVLEPQIRGFRNWDSVPMSGDADVAITTQRQSKEQRRDLTQRVIAALDAARAAMEALEADGYPRFDPVVIDARIFIELQGDREDLLAAIGVFRSREPATDMTITLGEPEPRPTA